MTTTYGGWVTIPLFILCYIVWRLGFQPGATLPVGLPIIGAKKGDWFPFWQATLRNSWDVKKATLEAYVQYRTQAAIFPMLGPGAQNFVLLPTSETAHVTQQPDTVLDLRQVIVQGLLYKYTVSDGILVSHPVHRKLINTTLTNQIGNLLPALAHETIWSFEQQWGTNSESFREVNIWNSLGRVVGVVTNRAFVGLPHCRNPALLDAGFGFARALPVSQLMLSFLWEPLRPLLSPLLTIPCRLYEHRFVRLLTPEVEERLRSKSTFEDRKNDFLQWSINQADESGDVRLGRTRTLAGRILLLNLVSIHTSSLTITNVILDLVSCGRPEVIQELRHEIETVLGQCGGVWTKSALAKMEKLDSVFRESARLNTLIAVGLRRRVMAKEGFTTSAGVHIPCGNFCAVHNLGVVHDPNVYKDPDVFHPFRFVGLRHDIDTGHHNNDHVQSARLTFAATGTDYLAFGNGRQACPGRFFAAAELKLLLAYVLMFYDVEPLPARPAETWIGIIRIPSPRAKIKVRRRKAEDVPNFFWLATE